MESQVVLGFDFGEVRIGVAVGNSITASARALTIIDGRTNAAKWPAVAKLIDEWCPACVVVGIPRHPDGTAHQVTALALKFARQLEGRFGQKVYVVDERYSSVTVGNSGDGAIDDEAAAVILQQWFDEGSPERTPQSIQS